MTATSPSSRLTVVRPLIGLVQGTALWAVVEYAKPLAGWKPAATTMLFALALLIPTIVLAAYRHLRGRTLAAWFATATVLVALASYYATWRTGSAEAFRPPEASAIGSLMFVAVALYVLHHLIEPADAARRWRAPYAAYVDASWRHAFQLAMALAFVGVVSGLLFLAAALFGAIGFETLATTLRSSRLQAPLLGASFGLAVASTDVRPALIDGVRRIAFALFSTLLPVVVGLVIVFLVLLPFAGLAPLWSTRHATTLLLTVSAWLVVLVNAAYQDGREQAATSAAVRWSARAAGLMLPILVALAAWALRLRIAQYGLSPERVGGVAVCALAACYAVGYAVAAVDRGPWMRRLEPVNLGAAIVAVVLVFAVASPVADPARLAAADQVARLVSGRTAVDRFDFASLRFRMDRYGQEALAGLAKADDAAIATRAVAALRLTAAQRWSSSPTPESLAHARVRPDGASLPAGFRAQAWSADVLRQGAAGCLVSDQPCDLLVIDLDGDGHDEVVAMATDNQRIAVVFARATDGTWRRVASWYETAAQDDGALRAAIDAGDMTTTTPLLRDLMIGGKRLHFSRGFGDDAPASTGAAPKR